jgi:hypothetical protein
VNATGLNATGLNATGRLLAPEELASGAKGRERPRAPATVAETELPARKGIDRERCSSRKRACSSARSELASRMLQPLGCPCGRGRVQTRSWLAGCLIRRAECGDRRWSARQFVGVCGRAARSPRSRASAARPSPRHGRGCSSDAATISSRARFSFDRFLALHFDRARGRRRNDSRRRDDAFNAAIAMRDDSKVDCVCDRSISRRCGARKIKV